MTAMVAVQARPTDRVSTLGVLLGSNNSPMTVSLGPITTQRHIRSTVGPFKAFLDYITVYPKTVIEALAELVVEYNGAFGTLVEANREWDTDYQCCFSNGSLSNFGVQIDMSALPDDFLAVAENMSVSEVRDILRKWIYEFENSLAMYQLLENTFSRGSGQTYFKKNFRAVLDGLRSRFGKPIALLAVTDEKYQAMRQSEYGKSHGEILMDEEVRQMSGFDRLFGPNEFLQHVESCGGVSHYLLYVRASDPVAKLKNPSLEVDHPLLGDPRLRQIIKAHALTPNVDAPDMEPKRRINDTKGYMSVMGMGHVIEEEEGLTSPQLLEYLQSCGVDSSNVLEGVVPLRAKPVRGTYGCYGHVRGVVNGKFKGDLRRELRRRGPYVIQPELPVLTIRDAGTALDYTAIDRIFFGTSGNTPTFLGGFRSLMPADSVEAKRGRNHGNANTVWAEITA